MGMVAAVVDFLFFIFLWGLILGRILIVVVVANFFFFLEVILVVKNWSLWLIFGGRWMCGFTGERQEREERKEIRVNCLYCLMLYFILF